MPLDPITQRDEYVIRMSELFVGEGRDPDDTRQTDQLFSDITDLLADRDDEDCTLANDLHWRIIERQGLIRKAILGGRYILEADGLGES